MIITPLMLRHAANDSTRRSAGFVVGYSTYVLPGRQNVRKQEPGGGVTGRVAVRAGKCLFLPCCVKILVLEINPDVPGLNSHFSASNSISKVGRIRLMIPYRSMVLNYEIVKHNHY